MQYVQKKLKEYGKEELVQTTTRADLDRLGGRLTDLETLIQKMRGGATVNEAVDGESRRETIETAFTGMEEADSLLEQTSSLARQRRSSRTASETILMKPRLCHGQGSKSGISSKRSARTRR